MVVILIVVSASFNNLKGDSITITSHYVGFVGIMEVQDMDSRDEYGSARVGGGLSWELHDGLSVKAGAFIDQDNDRFLTRSLFGLYYNVSDQINISAGFITTPSGLLRPSPFTLDGHLESWLTAKLPGVNPGVSLSLKVSSTTTNIGLVSRLGNPELHASFKTNKLNIGGYKNFNQSNWALFVETSLFDPVKIQGLITDSLYGTMVTANIAEVVFYGIGGWNKEKNLVQEFGILKFLNQGIFKGMVGAGYDRRNKSGKLYVAISL